MGFEAFRVPSPGAYFFLLVICALGCVGAVVLRFVATWRSNRTAAAEDWFALVAVLAFLIRVGFMFDLLTNVNGRTFDPQLDKQELEKIFKLQFADNFVFFLEQTFAKFSICALYRRIFGVNRVYRRWIYLLATTQLTWCIASTCLQLLQCRPIYKFWNFVDPGTCMPWTVILVTMGPLNSLVDFGLVVLAMVMIRPLRLHSRTKWKLRFLFGLGSLAGVFGFIKIGIAYSPDLLHVISSLSIWATIQSAFCIVCCCAPVYRDLSPHILWNNLASKICAHGPRFRAWQKKSNKGLQPRPWQLASLDSFLQVESHVHVRPMASSPVGRGVYIDSSAAYKTSDQEVDFFPGNPWPSIPGPSYFRAHRGPPEVS